MHIFASPGYVLCSVWPQIRYFGSIVLAIMLEDAVSGVKWLRTPRKVSLQVALKVYGKANGHVGGKANGKKAKTEKKEVDSPKTVAEAYPEQQITEDSTPWYLKLLGYCWVFFFHVWANSMAVYGFWTQCVG